jgi:hypothetical protein
MLRSPHASSTARCAAHCRANGRAVAVLVGVAALFALSFPALMLGAATPTGGTIGTFKFSGELGGTLKAPKRWNLGSTLTQAGCEKTVNKTSFNVFFYNVKLTLNGHETALIGGYQGAAILLNVVVRKYGDTESFANRATPGGVPDFGASVNFNAYSGRTAYSWETNAGSSTVVSSGTITTNAKGTGGSLSATLVPTGTGLPTGVSGHATALLTIKGSWSSCVPTPA